MSDLFLDADKPSIKPLNNTCAIDPFILYLCERERVMQKVTVIPQIVL